MNGSKVLVNTLVGVLIGIGIGYMMNVGMCASTGHYMAGVPELVSKVGDLRAAQMLLFYSGLIGAVFGGMRFVWEREDWSLLKRTAIYFVVNLSVMLFSAYQMCWIGNSVWSLVVFIAMFVAIFIVCWFIFHAIAKKRIQELNAGLKQL